MEPAAVALLQLMPKQAAAAINTPNSPDTSILPDLFATSITTSYA
jgi:hypothetical protein